MKNLSQLLPSCEKQIELESKYSKLSTHFSNINTLLGKVSSYFISLLAILLLYPELSFADTGSDELTPVLTFLTDNLNGIFGKIIVISSVILALIVSVVKFNGYIVAGCVGTALFAFYGDNFLIGIFGAII